MDPRKNVLKTDVLYTGPSSETFLFHAIYNIITLILFAVIFRNVQQQGHPIDTVVRDLVVLRKPSNYNYIIL